MKMSSRDIPMKIPCFGVQDILVRKQIIQNGNSIINRGGIRTGLGLDWDINKKNNVSAAVSFDRFNNDNKNFNNQIIESFKGGKLLSSEMSLLNANNHFNEHAFDFCW